VIYEIILVKCMVNTIITVTFVTNQSDSIGDRPSGKKKKMMYLTVNLKRLRSRGWTAYGEYRPRYDGVQVSMSDIQTLREYFALFTGNDLLRDSRPAYRTNLRARRDELRLVPP
jgi:hypothetical protein